MEFISLKAVIRHQDIFVKGGNITTIGQIIQLATILGTSIYFDHFMKYLAEITMSRQCWTVSLLEDLFLLSHRRSNS